MTPSRKQCSLGQRLFPKAVRPEQVFELLEAFKDGNDHLRLSDLSHHPVLRAPDLLSILNAGVMLGQLSVEDGYIVLTERGVKFKASPMNGKIQIL